MSSNILFDPFKYRSATAAVELSQPKLKPFLLTALFGSPEFHADDTIDFAVVSKNSKISQYVDDVQDPIIISKDGEEYKSIKIPRTFEAVIFTAKELGDYKALINSSIYSDVATRQREANRMILLKAEELKERVFRRREVMVAEIITTGKLVSTQPNVKFTTDFGFVTDTLANGGHLLPALTSTNVWGGTTADIDSNLFDMKTELSRRTGRTAEIVIMTNTAAKKFISDDKVKKNLDTNNYRIGRLDIEKVSESGVNYIGRYLGMDILQYNQQYESNAGEPTNLIPEGGIIMTYLNNRNNRLHIGGVDYIDENNQYQKIIREFHVKPERQKNGKALTWSCEQKSLPAIHEPNAFMYQKVL